MALSRQQLEELRAAVEAERREALARPGGHFPSSVTRPTPSEPSNPRGAGNVAIRNSESGSTNPGSSKQSLLLWALSHVGWLIPAFFAWLIGDWALSRHLEKERVREENVRIVKLFRDSRKVGATLRSFRFQWRSLQNKPGAYSLEKMNDYIKTEDVIVQDAQVQYRSKWRAVDGRQGSLDHVFWYGDFVRLDLRFDSDRQFHCVYFIDRKGFTIPMNGAYDFCSSNRASIVNARDVIQSAHSAWRNSHREVFDLIARLNSNQINRLK